MSSQPQHPEWIAAIEAGARDAGRYRLVTPRESMRGATGTRAGLQSGVSLDFRDYREYSPGDDLRHIDWNVCARTERYIVKLFREEVTPHLDIVLDISQSMALPGTAKAAAALRLRALLAGAAGNAACTVRCWQAGALCAPGPDGTPDAGWREPPAFTAVASPVPGLLAAAGSLKRNGIRVLISDLLWADDPVRALMPVADRAAALHVVQVLAESEQFPSLHGNLRLLDVENGEMRELFADAAALERYRRGLQAHQDAWQHACRRCGAHWAVLTAETIDRDRALEPLQRNALIE